MKKDKSAVFAYKKAFSFLKNFVIMNVKSMRREQDYEN